MTREELLRSKEYWVIQIQNRLYKIIEDFRIKNNLSRSGLAEKFGVSKGYISQVLNGDFDHKISKLVDLTLASGKVPIIEFKDLNEYIKEDSESRTSASTTASTPLDEYLKIDYESKIGSLTRLPKIDTSLFIETEVNASGYSLIDKMRSIAEENLFVSTSPSADVTQSSKSTKISTTNLFKIFS